MRPQLSIRVNCLKQGLSRATVSPRLLALHRATTVPHIPQYTTAQPFTGTLYFSSTPLLFKKKTKADREQAASSPAPESAEDPYDFSSLNSGIEKSLSKLQNDLSKLRTGGRFNTEVLENLRVHLQKDSKESFKLGDLAQIIPKGRTVMLMVGEKDHIKPITSTIQGSKELNLQPQPDPHNSSQLNIPIPPPTKESRDLALSVASRAGEIASTGVRNARAAMQKKLRAMELKKVVRPDDLKKAHKEMEKIVETGVADVKKTVDAARKTMEQA